MRFPAAINALHEFLARLYSVPEFIRNDVLLGNFLHYPLVLCARPGELSAVIGGPHFFGFARNHEPAIAIIVEDHARMTGTRSGKFSRFVAAGRARLQR